MKRSLKKSLAILLIAFLVIPLFPLNALADSSEEVKIVEEIEEKEVKKEETRETNQETQKNEYTVTFNANDGSAVVSQNIYENEKVIEPSTPVKEGHDFKGWFTDDKFATRWNFENDLVTKDITLYAKWDIKEFTVIFKDHDGTELSNKIIEYGKDAISPKKPSREKYIFTGWDKKFINVKSNLVVTAEYKIDRFARIDNLDLKGSLYSKNNHTIQAKAETHNKVLYQYWVKDLSNGSWLMIKDYSQDTSAIWTPEKSGKYLYGVHIKDEQSDAKLDTHLYKEITIKTQETEIKQLKVEGNMYKNSKQTLNADGVSENGVLYQYWIKDLSENRWVMIKDYSEETSVIWSPQKTGKYLYGVHIKDKNSEKKLDKHLYKEIIIKDLPGAKLEKLEIEGNNYNKDSHKISAIGDAANGPLYQYWVKDLSKNRWIMIKDYSQDTSTVWTPQKSGKYLYGVHIKDENSDKKLDNHIYKNIIIKRASTKIKKVNLKGNAYENSPQTIYSESISENKTLYQYWAKNLSNGHWSMIKDYSTSTSATWVPKEPGKYLYGVHVKDKYSTKKLDAHLYKEISIKNLPKATVSSLSINGTANANNTQVLIANGNSTNQVLYQFWIKDLSNNKWSIIRDYSKINTITWTPKNGGNYLYGVHIKDEYSKDRLDTHLYKSISIKGGLKSLYGKTIMLDPGHGGRDSGAINGSLDIKEKNYNNALSMKIRERLIALGANVTFTRNPWEDKFIHLHDRTPIVNKQKPDLMLSVHHDSSANKSVSGMSVHYSSYRPGMDTSNAYVKYNGREYKFVREIRNWWDPVRKTRDPGIVYLDKGREKTVNINDVMVYDNRKPSDVVKKSKKLADNLYSSLGTLNYSKKYSYIKDHNLHMTRWSNVPSALIEAGFISNNTEVKRVGKDSERNKIAQAVVNAIVSYFK